MNKKDLIKLIANQEGLPLAQIDKVISAFVSSVQLELQSGRCVKLQGLGTFEVRERAPRKGRNLKTGQNIFVPSRTSPIFRPSEILKELVDKQPTH